MFIYGIWQDIWDNISLELEWWLNKQTDKTMRGLFTVKIQGETFALSLPIKVVQVIHFAVNKEAGLVRPVNNLDLQLLWLVEKGAELTFSTVAFLLFELLCAYVYMAEFLPNKD